MALSRNQVHIIGYLGKDAEIASMPDGKSVANLQVATTENWPDGNGRRKTKTDWHRVVVYGDKLCEIVKERGTKGALATVHGKLQTRKWKDDSGDHYVTEIIVSGPGLIMLQPKEVGDVPEDEA